MPTLAWVHRLLLCFQAQWYSAWKHEDFLSSIFDVVVSIIRNLFKPEKYTCHLFWGWGLKRTILYKVF
jgi:hypothetical protein